MTAAVHLKWGVKISLRDGVRLNATLYMPESHSKATPVIFTMTPYIGQNYHDVAVSYAAHGYPFLTIDVRGRGNSDGVFNPNNEARDGYDVVEWIAREPYCNGKVAMWGGSYAGYVQWATAKEFPPHLSTIVPVAAPYRGVDSPVRNNIFSTYTMRWLTFLAGRTSQEKIFGDQAFWCQRFRSWYESGIAYKDLDSFLGNPSAIFQEWVAHPHRDAYWDSYNPTAEQYARLSIPVLTITGIYDADQSGALTHYQEHCKNAPAASRARHYLVIGPWDHAGTRAPQLEFCGLKVGGASQIDVLKLHLQWYAWTMGDGPRPEFLRNNLAYYVTAADKWRYAESLEQITARSEALYLQSTGPPTDVFSGGLLAAECSDRSDPDSYVYDPQDVSEAALECVVDPGSLVDQRILHAGRGQRLVYHGIPFVEDTEVSGFFRLRAWIAIDQPDTDFRVSIYEIDSNGSSVLLTSDSLRARYRESPRVEKLIHTRAPLQYDFKGFMFVSRLIRRGHRLRLVLGPVKSIFSQKNYNSGGVVSEETMKDARVVTVQLFHDSLHPSALYVPFAHPEN
jgi:putative CocE/NonD family hydrolase